jgi:hypothetical protein
MSYRAVPQYAPGDEHVEWNIQINGLTQSREGDDEDDLKYLTSYYGVKIQSAVVFGGRISIETGCQDGIGK